MDVWRRAVTISSSWLSVRGRTDGCWFGDSPWRPGSAPPEAPVSGGPALPGNAPSSRQRLQHTQAACHLPSSAQLLLVSVATAVIADTCRELPSPERYILPAPEYLYQPARGMFTTNEGQEKLTSSVSLDDKD